MKSMKGAADGSYGYDAMFNYLICLLKTYTHRRHYSSLNMKPQGEGSKEMG